MGLDLLHILTTSLYKANFTDPGDFIFTIYLDVKELEIYEQAMSCSYAKQCTPVISEEVD